jgi:hypothetical protein
MIYYKVVFETTNCLRPCNSIYIEFRYDMTDNNLQRLLRFVFFLITLYVFKYLSNYVKSTYHKFKFNLQLYPTNLTCFFVRCSFGDNDSSPYI